MAYGPRNLARHTAVSSTVNRIEEGALIQPCVSVLPAAAGGPRRCGPAGDVGQDRGHEVGGAQFGAQVARPRLRSLGEGDGLVGVGVIYPRVKSNNSTLPVMTCPPASSTFSRTVAS